MWIAGAKQVHSLCISGVFFLLLIQPAAYTGADAHADPQAEPLGLVKVTPFCVAIDRNRLASVVLTLRGLDIRQDVRVLVNGQDAAIERMAAGTLEIRFATAPLRPGPVSLRISTGQEEYFRNSAFFLVGELEILRDELDSEKRHILQAGQTTEFRLPGISLGTVEISLGGRGLQGEMSGGWYKVQIPLDLGGQLLRLAAVAFGETVWTRPASIRPGPRVERVSVTYGRRGKWLKADVRGRNLGQGLEVLFSSPEVSDPIEWESTLGDQAEGWLVFKTNEAPTMRDPGLDCSLRIHWRGVLLYEAHGAWLVGPDQEWEWSPGPLVAGRSNGSILDTIVAESFRGTVHLGGSDMTFVVIPVRTFYPIGLTSEQAEDPYLMERGLSDPSVAASPKRPVLVSLVHAFLIQDSEVTAGQYWPFLLSPEGRDAESPPLLRKYLERRDAVLPRELRDLPVTDVSYLGATRFADWLQKELSKTAPGWRVRLPHEIEWEMAARDEPRMFSFPDTDLDKAWPYLEKPTPRAPRTNVFDKTTRGVWDITGNARELTATMYDPNLLTKLSVQISAGMFDGWDPRAPTATPGLQFSLPDHATQQSYMVAVRGGANGEHPSLLQVSVRRQQEWRDHDETVGFRLVLVQHSS